jgi:DNA-binding NarL/FixJ family response regulator
VLKSREFDVQEIEHQRWDYFRAVEQWQPRVVLVDLCLPQRRAVDLARRVCKFLPDVKVLLLVPGRDLSGYEREKLLECVEIGVQGYIPDESDLNEFTQAIHQALEGETYCCWSIFRTVFADLASQARESQWLQAPASGKLTRRELEVLQWVAEGMSNKEVAVRMSVSLNTVKNHIHNILRKLDVADRFEAVQRAVDSHWLKRARGLSSARR